MAKTSLSDNYSNLCRDYSSFIKWAISKISKNTTKWTDYTVSEPDTLILSSISTMHDYAQYIIDQMYLNTDIDICTTEFLHQVSAAMGQYLAGTNTITIPIRIINRSQENITINPYEVFIYNNELFVNPEKIIIPANLSSESYIVRNTVNEMIYKLNKNSNGEFILNGSIEIGSLNIYGIKEDGSQTKLNSCDYIFDLLYDSGKYNYLITSINDKKFRIKISPFIQKSFTAILVKYTIIDDYPIKENLQLKLLSDKFDDNNLLITTINSVSIDSDIPITSEKLTYLNSLTNVRTLCNKPYNLNLGELLKRIEDYRLTYEPNVNRTIIPFFEYTTFDNKPLYGDPSQTISSDYFKNIAISSGILNIQFNDIPVYDLTITYNSDITVTIINSVLKQLTSSSNTISITLQNYDSQDDVFIGFKNLGNFIQYHIDTQGNKEITYLATEMSLLIEKFLRNTLIMHQTPEIKFLSPYILDLSSEITLIQDIDHLIIMTQITTLLYDTLIHGEIISNVRGSYRRLELLIQNNIKEISQIKFVSIKYDQDPAYVVTSNQHLVINSPENYLSSGKIKFSTKGDES